MVKFQVPTRARNGVSTPLEVRLSTSNFGPIESGEVNLRPLTVFVGPSNSGKTYFATLIYALHRILDGFPRLPVQPFEISRKLRYLEKASKNSEAHDKEVSHFLNTLVTRGATLNFSDIPQVWRELILAPLNGPKGLGADLQDELGRCFDLESVSNLIRWSDTSAESEIELSVEEEDRSLWQLRLNITDSGINAEGKIEDNEFKLERSRTKELESLAFGLRHNFAGNQKSDDVDSYEQNFLIERCIELLFRERRSLRNKAHYLPAARSGIMQSHRVIASSLVKRSTRAGFQPFPELPTFSGVMADFMQGLILYDERTATAESMEDLAEALESRALAGKIRTRRASPDSYPEFVYRPKGSNEDIRLTRASSMVSELAPVVLFLRGVIRGKDLLIIEEPEAHLHPAAQTQMAAILSRMVRAGLQVLVTTHSDWLLKELSNLMREGKLGEMRAGETTNGSLPTSLQPNEVGIWKFSRDSTTGTSNVEEIPFDPIEGVEPQDYEDIAVDLYNRAANLQDRLQESENG